MAQLSEKGPTKKESILNAAIGVFGQFGFQKTSVDDIAEAAHLSKQGLYLHFSSKQEIFLASLQKYLDDGLILVQEELSKGNSSLYDRLLGAMDAWFGRHYATFSPKSFDIIKTGNSISGVQIEKYKDMFRSKIAKAIAESTEFKRSKNIYSPKEISQVLFLCGLTWKEEDVTSRADLIKKFGLCIRVCCQIET
ncbi:TetR/AcrR family transcriptional regulator [Leptospira langatensis]|uniref:TetR/AcrR family transcriptional regulator n=1 Tax=Leptospira langatensis TaxID=2484983 RepID=A0A5F1ZWE8_9LEPT|nr:TetR/AcrR family transcriptional regulator [Leptospira langatensis]TGJ98357.1 TetR/AcrR family transcriptional regulator [Leptospira langatensis]TGL43271.1 TetR/AcrR family transcriptional regulator [Leptospira langatensis]